MEKVLIFGKNLVRAEVKLRELESSIAESDEELIVRSSRNTFRTNTKEYVAVSAIESSRGYKGTFACVDDEIPIWALYEIIYPCLNVRHDLPVKERISLFSFRRT